MPWVCPAMAVYNCGNGIISAARRHRRPLHLSVRCRCAERGSELCSSSSAATWPPRGVAIASAIAAVHCRPADRACTCCGGRTPAAWSSAASGSIKAASGAVLMIGVPSGLQNAIFAVANLFVQVGLNSFDARHGLRAAPPPPTPIPAV
ncbi:MAG: hypothetical protein ACLUNQ_07570 [Oscillospiraceae bacterium]